MTVADNVVHAFSADHVIKLTGLSDRQLRYWDRTGFFSPQFDAKKRRAPYGRVYSFRDVVGLRTIAILLKDHSVSLQHLRRVAERLSGLSESLWSDTRIYVVNREVHIEDPETGSIRGALSGQYAMIPLIEVMNNIAEECQKLKERNAGQRGQIERHRYVARNSWVVAGTRIPTAAIRRFSEAGYSADQILQEYPSLTKEDVEAALKHEKGISQSA